MRICSITHHQVVNNPRLFREADALAAAGHDVRVVAVRRIPEQSARDAELAQGRTWRLQQVNIERTREARGAWLRTGVRRRLAMSLWRKVRRGKRLAGFAYTRTFQETIGLVLGEPTDLIIAHTQPMLAPAYFAARRVGCLWGFDCEDILSEEYGEGIQDIGHQALVRYVERAFVPRADYVTVASESFGRWLRQRCGLSHPVLIKNVPSLAEAPTDLLPGYPSARPYLSLHWFSQSIGPLRGIEDAIRALPHLQVPAQLHLRGETLPEFREPLRSLISELGVGDRVFIHERIAPHELIRSAAHHDIGLALMQPCCVNHQLAVPNKLFAFMMAGLAVGATRTEGHLSVLADAPGVGFTYDPGDVLDLARQINRLAADPDLLMASRRTAFNLARARFNWELEQKALVDLVAGLEGRVRHR